jgi:hypothetical protein
MESKRFFWEAFIVFLASLILGFSIAFRKPMDAVIYAFLSFVIIITVNILVKIFAGYLLEIDVKTKLWSWHRYWFRKGDHFAAPLPMIWAPLVLSLITQGALWWLAILEFDVAPRVERVSKKHGLYRFTEVTEWHVGWIATFGLISSLLLGIIGYLAGFELFAKISIFYAAWSIIPLSSLDGNKILFASRALWATIAVITAILTFWAMMIV